ncbi:MAG: YceD family protein [Actinomycetota bacterium]
MAVLTVSVADILGRPGVYRELHLDAVVPGIHTALARLAPDPAHADLRAESVVEGILVTGRVEADATLECARCLKEFSSDVAVDVCELFVAPGHEETADEDAYRVAGEQIDLEPMVRDALALALPLNPVCEATCKGMCARCGKDLSQGPCECSDDELDPRWAELSALKDQLKEV